MRKHSWEPWRDFAVRLLARLSLVVVLSVLGALFVGSAATGQAAPDPSVGTEASAGSTQERILDRAHPVGLLLGVAVIGGGVVVLMVGALRPPARTGPRSHVHTSLR